MRQPIREEIQTNIRSITKTLADINFLLDNYDEQLVKEYVLYLLEEVDKYRAKIRELTARLDSTFGDFEYINPQYKDSYSPERY